MSKLTAVKSEVSAFLDLVLTLTDSTRIALQRTPTGLTLSAWRPITRDGAATWLLEGSKLLDTADVAAVLSVLAAPVLGSQVRQKKRVRQLHATGAPEIAL